jgi:hypothetical protein
VRDLFHIAGRLCIGTRERGRGERERDDERAMTLNPRQLNHR